LFGAESLDAITEAISLKLNERGKVFNEILQPSTQNQLKQSQVLFTLLDHRQRNRITIGELFDTNYKKGTHSHYYRRIF